ncbi:DUF1566 domain-containing protein [Pseudoalteromonas sp. MMG010]|uniref:Lcl C-terminal domain-containing protein n=1 Tax=Pseudoalteromonas sp. MMG010 TaxID=2822685 RepID=UPI001B3A28DA|nr:DUF1566 domain-containing protein [Pseudoalteromonas sp. MMG010]MBQ4833962.1 DUF1566 domain-containing protein [Pseudoalteromonas sp. MMG010]
MKYIYITAVSLFVLSSHVAAQTCYDSVDETSLTARFTINADGTVSDTQTGLMWQVCSYGQSYDSDTNTCTGSAQQLTWQEALRGAQNDDTASYDDWQVPNIKELATILEHSCTDPSINESVFFDTESQNYWSNTSGVTTTGSAWVYQFDSGLNSLHDKTSNVYLRLVRYEE